MMPESIPAGNLAQVVSRIRRPADRKPCRNTPDKVLDRVPAFSELRLGEGGFLELA